MNNPLNALSEISIKYEPKVQPINRPKITSSEDAYKHFLELLEHSVMTIKEEAVVLFLNRSNRVLGGYKISSGGITGTVVDIRLILAIALKSLASGLILAHTHPSGELLPSRADKDLTQKLKDAAKLMDISLFDHLILTTESYYSFAEEGIL